MQIFSGSAPSLRSSFHFEATQEIMIRIHQSMFCTPKPICLNSLKSSSCLQEQLALSFHRPKKRKSQLSSTALWDWCRGLSLLLCRYQLNKIVVDTEAGPYRNRTVLFLGSSRGTILKFLIMPNQDNTVTSSNVFLEELEGFNPDK